MKTASMEIASGVHRFVQKEARTVAGRTCKCCGRYLEEKCFTLFMLHENGRQYVVVGFQCFICERDGNEKWQQKQKQPPP